MFYWLPISVISLHKWRKIKTQNKGLASHHRAPRHLKTLYVFLQFLSWKLSCLIFIKQRGGEGNDRGWDGWMASPIWWTWVWAGSRSWWWTGKLGVLQSMGSQRVRHDWAPELNWQLIYNVVPVSGVHVHTFKVTQLMSYFKWCPVFYFFTLSL